MNLQLNLKPTPRRVPAVRAIGWYLCGVHLVDLELLGDPLWIGLDLVAGIGRLDIVGEGLFAIFAQRGTGLEEWGSLSVWSRYRGRESWQLRSRDGRTIVFPGAVDGTVVFTGGCFSERAGGEIGGLPCAIQG